MATAMDVEEINPDQEIDFCTLGMFILGKLLCLFCLSSVYPPRRRFTPVSVGVVCTVQYHHLLYSQDAYIPLSTCVNSLGFWRLCYKFHICSVSPL